MCGCEFNFAAAGGAIAGVVPGHFSYTSNISAIYNSATCDNQKLPAGPRIQGA